MEVHIAQGHNPPHNIHGITVVIDVIRAFTFLGSAAAWGLLGVSWILLAHAPA